MIRETKQPYRPYWAAIAIGLVLAAWQGIAMSGWIPAFLLPSPLTVVQTLEKLVVSGQVSADISASLFRILSGFLISAAIAIPLGLWISVSKAAHQFFTPLLNIAKYLPVLAFIPLMILWFGVGDASKIFLLVLGTTPYFMTLVIETVERIPEPFLETAQTMGLSRSQILWHVILPHASPQIVESGRVSMAICWSWITIAEIISAPNGLGHLILQSQRYLKVDVIFAAIVLITLLGFAFDRLFLTLRARWFVWEAKAFREKNPA